MSDIPEEIMKEASGIWIEALEEGSPDPAIIIARALISAEARGMERAAKIADKASIVHRKCMDNRGTCAIDGVAAAIRNGTEA